MGFLLRNWHLKLSAVLLATVLYTGLVFSGSFSDADIQVRIDQDNASRDSYVLTGDLGFVTVNYRVSNDVAGRIVADSFQASVDLSDYDMERSPQPQQLPIEVRTDLDGVQILSWDPREARVEIDSIEVRSVPVVVDMGDVPDGLRTGDAVLSDDEVEIRGPGSVVGQVDRAVAFVAIPASGIDFNEPVVVQPVDVRGQPVGIGQVDVDPETVSVQIDVEPVETTATVIVRPSIEGTPAPGFALDALSVDPSAVILRGVPELLAEITELATEVISIDGVSEDQTFEVELQLPDDVRLASGDDPVVTVTVTIVPSVSSRTFVVGVLCQNAGENACLPGHDQVSVTLSGPGEVLSTLTASALTPVLDAGGLAPGSYSLTPILPALPEGVELLALEPGAVPVTIVAPAEPTPAPTPTP
ncbi:MAG TPA: CdaR family protein [Candidatus Limnocylindria bacterium]